MNHTRTSLKEAAKALMGNAINTVLFCFVFQTSAVKIINV